MPVALQIRERRANDFDAILLVIALAFLGSIVFALPYAIISLVLFKFLLPKTRITAFFLGVFCAVAAQLTLNVVNAGFICLIQTLWSYDFLLSLGQLIPTGLTATYIFGAVGMGYGFRNWPLKWW